MSDKEMINSCCDNNMLEEEADKGILVNTDNKQTDASLKQETNKKTDPEQPTISYMATTNENNASISNDDQSDTEEESDDETDLKIDIYNIIVLENLLDFQKDFVDKINGIISWEQNMKLTKKENSSENLQDKLQMAICEKELLEEKFKLVELNMQKMRMIYDNREILILRSNRGKLDYVQQLVDHLKNFKTSPKVCGAQSTEETTEPQQPSLSNTVATNERNSHLSNNENEDSDEPPNEMDLKLDIEEILLLKSLLISQRFFLDEINRIRSKLKNIKLTEGQNSNDELQETLQMTNDEKDQVDKMFKLVKVNMLTLRSCFRKKIMLIFRMRRGNWNYLDRLKHWRLTLPTGPQIPNAHSTWELNDEGVAVTFDLATSIN